MADREAGTGKFISRGNAGGTPEEVARVEAAVKEMEEAPRQRTPQETKSVTRRLDFGKQLFNNACRVIRPSEKIDSETLDGLEKEWAEQELGAIPARCRPAARAAFREIVQHVSEGSNAPAWERARTAAFALANELPESWSEPQADDTRSIDEVVDAIPRG